MKKREDFTKKEIHNAVMQFYKESDPDIKAFDKDLGRLSVIKRERLYFILAIIFGFLFNLSASAIDNLVQTYSADKRPSNFYFTYATIVIALSFGAIVWMTGKIRDLDQYIILLANRKQTPDKKRPPRPSP